MKPFCFDDPTTWHPPIAWQAKKLFRAIRPPTTVQDLYAAGRLGVVRAKSRFDPKKACSAYSWASRHIRWEMLTELELMQPTELLPLDEERTQDPSPLLLDAHIDLQKAVAHLNEANRQLLCDIYLRFKSAAVIGRELGVCESRIGQRKQQAIAFLRRYLND